ncbi:MAG: redoxin domain-containing protein, partial [Chloroflexota bacterium]|nr:redoxin domain-containing protein [Chloroflexota bacterium]
MAEARPPQLAPAQTASAPPALSAARRLVTIGLGLVLAVALVVGAWFVGGQQGFDQIGRGGINSRLLPRVGEPAPDFFTVLGDGEVVLLSDYRGQPVWLNFWGSWCPP